jgi:hypothetical protein
MAASVSIPQTRMELSVARRIGSNPSDPKGRLRMHDVKFFGQKWQREVPMVPTYLAVCELPLPRLHLVWRRAALAREPASGAFSKKEMFSHA